VSSITVVKNVCQKKHGSTKNMTVLTFVHHDFVGIGWSLGIF
jgi:hypothetical protein